MKWSGWVSHPFGPPVKPISVRWVDSEVKSRRFTFETIRSTKDSVVIPLKLQVTKDHDGEGEMGVGKD